MGTDVARRQLAALEQFIRDHSLEAGFVVNLSEEVCWLTPQILQVPAGVL